MIVRMSKVEIVGTKSLLQDVLSLLRELCIFQIEPATVRVVEEEYHKDIRSFLPDEKTAFERFFLEDLLLKIDELFSYLPKSAVRESYLEPLSVLDTIAKMIQRHIAASKELHDRREALQKELAELGRFKIYLRSLASLLESTTETPDLDFIGLVMLEPGRIEHLREGLSRITDWRFELVTEAAEDGSLVGLITVEKDVSERVKKALSDEHVPELTFPASFGNLTFPERITYVMNKIGEVSREIEKIDAELEKFCHRWVPIYQGIREWIDDRLALMSTAAFAFETRMCFFIYGWIPSRDLEGLRRKLAGLFGGRVTLEEKEVHEEDLEQIPIILKNPPYFRPFELLTGVLPLPLYTSYDPTPFIGIFFPIFFGMILGDAGYGLILFLTSFFLLRFGKQGPVRDGAKILLISSLYSFFFGVLFGEFFGDLPHRLFGLEPICIERRTAVIPMLYFALSVGIVHIILGLFLGALTAFRKKTKKEAAYKLLSILIIFCLIAVFASFFGLFPPFLTQPVILVILFLTPFLFFTGGVLAPLEFLKNIGNIISYVRIMAIGLTSVLLAFVANQLGGLAGNIAIGVVVAGLLHVLNIILGVFSPTIHSLRLHYVEFFSKFIEHGGRKFTPLKK
ncbi:MAG TPA: V-type ATPase 116kDa subunit family protein [Thermodesulfovibrionales bacterium]|nr:V-type ATPase 116kDa subunit family protein [Thermodesulfovibrionales bacterium]